MHKKMRGRQKIDNKARWNKKTKKKLSKLRKNI